MGRQSKNLTTAMSKLITTQPFFAILLTDLMEIQETTGVENIATNEHTIFINPEWFDTNSVDESVFWIAHEIMHTVFKHMSRGETWQRHGVGPDFKKFQMSRWNKACDYVVNITLHEAGIGKMPIDALSHPAVTVDSQVDDVYAMLPEDPEDEENDDQVGDDQHQKPQPGQVPSQAKVDRALNQAKDAAKAQGSGNGVLDRLVEEITNPKVDWKEVMREFMVDTMGRDETTWARCNRRRLALPPHIPMPGTKGSRSGNIAIVVDASGSISDTEIAEFMGEVQGILQEAPPELCKLYWTHTNVFQVDEVDEDTDLSELKPSESGGTDMEAGLTVAEEDMPDLDAIIVLTDGYTNFQEIAPVNVPVMWVMTTDQRAPYGNNIQLEE